MIPADIIVTVHEKPQLYFKRIDANVEYSAFIAPSQKNGNYEVSIYGGKKLSFALDDDAFGENAVKIFPGQGLPIEDDETQFGDFIVKFTVVSSVGKLTKYCYIFNI